MTPVKVIDYCPSPIDDFGDGNGWGLYDCCVRFPDGTIKRGSIQGDTYNWALETFEEN